MLYDILGKIGNYTCKIVTKEDNVRSEALRALNKWNGINTNNIDSYLDDIVALHVVIKYKRIYYMLDIVQMICYHI